jgi:hypothetical protein
MRRLGLVLALSALFVVCRPASAAAVSWWRLEQLSGPRFDGYAFEARVWCLAEKGNDIEAVAGLALAICNLKDGQKRRASLDLNFGLFQADGDSRFAGGEAIKMILLEPSFSAHVWGPVEVGIAAGMSWFSSKGFESFRKFTLEPFRLDFRPLQWTERRRTNDKWYPLNEAIVIRTGWLVFPAGFEASEFKFERIPAEAVWYYGFFFDAGPLLQKLRSLTK